MRRPIPPERSSWLLLLLTLAKWPAPGRTVHPGLLRSFGAGRGVLLGVAPGARLRYPPLGACLAFHCRTDSFTCLDGTQTIPSRHINDDYCDCDDGSDEPSTGACAGLGLFYCAEQGDPSRRRFISSSRVRDGICDCCDGSDELAGCVDQCAMLGAYEALISEATTHPAVAAKAADTQRRKQLDLNIAHRQAALDELARLTRLQLSSDDKFRNGLAEFGAVPVEPLPRAPPKSAALPVEEPQGAASTAPLSTQLKRVVATKGRPFGNEPGDLTFRAGDKIVVERQDDPLWWHGYVEGPHAGAHGRFPSNLVVAVHSGKGHGSALNLLRPQVSAAEVAALIAPPPLPLPRQERSRSTRRVQELAQLQLNQGQLDASFRAEYLSLRKERASREIRMKELRQLLAVQEAWVHYFGHCLTASASVSIYEYRICFFDKVERTDRRDMQGGQGLLARSWQVLGLFDNSSWSPIENSSQVPTMLFNKGPKLATCASPTEVRVEFWCGQDGVRSVIVTRPCRIVPSATLKCVGSKLHVY
jgi:hypothetical protein